MRRNSGVARVKVAVGRVDGRGVIGRAVVPHDVVVERRLRDELRLRRLVVERPGDNRPDRRWRRVEAEARPGRTVRVDRGRLTQSVPGRGEVVLAIEHGRLSW